MAKSINHLGRKNCRIKLRNMVRNLDIDSIFKSNSWETRVTSKKANLATAHIGPSFSDYYETYVEL